VSLRDRLREETGSALVEFVFVALVVFLPLVYVVAGFSAVQRGVFASTEAAREAGRAIGTASDLASGLARAERAAQLAVEDQSVDATDVRVQYAPDGADPAAAGLHRRQHRDGPVRRRTRPLRRRLSYALAGAERWDRWLSAANTNAANRIMAASWVSA
jgi:hypothetical protein